MSNDLFTNEDLNIFTFPIDSNKLNKWCPYGKDSKVKVRTDCAINALKFIDVIEDEIASNLAILANENNKGTLLPELVYMMHKKYRNYNFYLKKIKSPYSYLRDLQKSYGVISVFTRVNEMGHLQIISKDNNNNFYIIDTQSQEIYDIKTPKQLKDYMKAKEYQDIYVLVTEEIKDTEMYIDKKRALKETNIEIRRPNTISPPLKKIRLNNLSNSRITPSNSRMDIQSTSPPSPIIPKAPISTYAIPSQLKKSKHKISKKLKKGTRKLIVK